MNSEEQNLSRSIKRLIHVVTTGNNTPVIFGSTSLYKAELHILEIIGEKKGITASDIAEEMEVTKGAVSQIVAKLVRKGLVLKSVRPDDRKSQELHLSKKGEIIFLSHKEWEQELVKKMRPNLKNVTPESVAVLSEILNCVADFVQK